MIKSHLKHLILEETEFWNVTDTQPAFLTFQPLKFIISSFLFNNYNHCNCYFFFLQGGLEKIIIHLS